MEAIDKALNILKETSRQTAAHPLAVPVVVGILTVFITVLVFFRISSSTQKKNKKTPKGKASIAPAGTTTVNGIRRSTRWALCLTFD